MEIINAPSLANCSCLELGRQVRELVDGGADWFHIDIMDGHYVPNIILPVKVIGELKRAYPQVQLDAHLCVTDPMDYFQELKDNGADWVSFHIDATNFVRRALSKIHALGMKAGVIINPSQSVELIEPYIHDVDYVVLMTVEPGFAGQKFMVDSLPRLKRLVDMRSRYGCSFLISIDGGVDYPNAIECAKMGAEVYITGIYTVFNQPDGITAACRRFKKTLYDAIAE